MSHFLRPPEGVNARSIEAAPPPEISKASEIARSARGYSIPLLPKKLGQWTPMTAVSMTQAIKNAPNRVSSPKNSSTPPMSSESAAAPSHSHEGRMNENGVFPDVNVLKPGPLKLPRTFCDPWATNIAAMARRSGIVDKFGEVAISLLNMAAKPSGFVISARAVKILATHQQKGK